MCRSLLVTGIIFCTGFSTACRADDSPVTPLVRLNVTDGKCDQDDLCFYTDEKDPQRSLILTSDKKGGAIRTFDLSGRLLHTLKVGKPGNIDLRRNISWNGKVIPLVAWNQREPESRLRLAALDPQTGKLDLLDGEGIPTASHYGGTLYHSRKSDKLYFLGTTKGDADVTQYELLLDSKDVTARKVRSWKLGEAECAVADDEAGIIYISEEAKGVWKIDAEPDAPAPGELVIKVGEHQLAADVEGLTLASGPVDSRRWLIVSSQGNNRFNIYDREHSHAFVGTFSIQGATATDGIDLLLGNISAAFPQGVFGCHTDAEGHPVLLCSWQDLVTRLSGSSQKSK